MGSGLTAVDAVMALRARGHQGPITLVSRHGLLPAVRRLQARHGLLPLSVPRLEALARGNAGLGLADVIALATAELAEAGADAAAVPATHQPATAARTLVASLVAQGLAVPHPFGGVRVERTTSRLITWRGVPDARLHALGDLTHVAYLFTFGMPVLAARAERIAHDIAATIQNGARRDHLPVGDGQITANTAA